MAEALLASARHAERQQRTRAAHLPAQLAHLELQCVAFAAHAVEGCLLAFQRLLLRRKVRAHRAQAQREVGDAALRPFEDLLHPQLGLLSLVRKRLHVARLRSPRRVADFFERHHLLLRLLELLFELHDFAVEPSVLRFHGLAGAHELRLRALPFFFGALAVHFFRGNQPLRLLPLLSKRENVLSFLFFCLASRMFALLLQLLRRLHQHRIALVCRNRRQRCRSVAFRDAVEANGADRVFVGAHEFFEDLWVERGALGDGAALARLVVPHRKAAFAVEEVAVRRLAQASNLPVLAGAHRTALPRQRKRQKEGGVVDLGEANHLFDAHGDAMVVRAQPGANHDAHQREGVRVHQNRFAAQVHERNGTRKLRRKSQPLAVPLHLREQDARQVGGHLLRAQRLSIHAAHALHRIDVRLQQLARARLFEEGLVAALAVDEVEERHVAFDSFQHQFQQVFAALDV